MKSPTEPGRSGERELIDHIRRRLPAARSSLLVGPGDDAAVVVPTRGAFQVLTTDAIVEGIHFDRRFSSLADVGHKAIAVNLSDLAAMGARPEFALLSFILPDTTTTADVDGLLDGILGVAAAHKVAIAGGNISRSPGPLVVDVTVTGSVRPRRILTRGAGQPGDALYLTGSIGGAYAGLAHLQAGGDREGELAACVQRHLRPEPRVRLGMLLGRNRAASACMDLSDGLADAVTQLAQASGTGAVIDGAALPIDPAARKWFESQELDPLTAALAGGDDFELLFAAPRKLKGRLRGVIRHAGGVPITSIGELTSSPEIVVTRGESREPLPSGFSHF